MAATADEVREQHIEESEQKVSPLELFFDLVFVFAFTQVTSLMSQDPTFGGLGRGMLVLAAVWWAWAAYAWLTNNLDPESAEVRIPIFGVMAAMLIASLAVPHAFGDDAKLFGVAYLIVRVLHIVLFAQASHDVDLEQAARQLAPTAFIGPGLILAAGFSDGGVQVALWVIGLAIDFYGPFRGGGQDWRVHPGHFAERHGLIIIIAIGESIVAVGVGASEIGLNGPVVAAAVLATVIATAIWWCYFDVVAPVAERVLRRAEGSAQARLARDSYSYLHLPMVAGIVLLALGVKKALGGVDEPLKTVPAIGLCGGVALYLLALNAFRLRNVGTLNRQRLVAAVVLIALIPVALEVDALVSVALVTAVCVCLVAYEALRFREARARVRAGGAAPPPIAGR